MTYVTNKNAIIQSRVSRNGKYRTETARRDYGADNFAASTDNNGATSVFLDFEGGNIKGGDTVRLDGRQARTLYRILQNHFEYVGKTSWIK